MKCGTHKLFVSSCFGHFWYRLWKWSLCELNGRLEFKCLRKETFVRMFNRSVGRYTGLSALQLLQKSVFSWEPQGIIWSKRIMQVHRWGNHQGESLFSKKGQKEYKSPGLGVVFCFFVFSDAGWGTQGAKNLEGFIWNMLVSERDGLISQLKFHTMLWFKDNV